MNPSWASIRFRLGVILRLIRRLNDTLGITSMVVSHDVQEISTVADQVFLLSGGKVVARGTPQELQVQSVGDRAAIHRAVWPTVRCRFIFRLPTISASCWRAARICEASSGNSGRVLSTPW